MSLRMMALFLLLAGGGCARVVTPGDDSPSPATANGCQQGQRYSVCGSLAPRDPGDAVVPSASGRFAAAGNIGGAETVSGARFQVKGGINVAQ